jgi:cell division protease FtsH
LKNITKILLIFLLFISFSFNNYSYGLTYETTSKEEKIDDRMKYYKGSILVLKDSTKITPFNYFEKLCESGYIDVVYYDKNYENIFFTVKDNANVVQVDYKGDNLQKTVEEKTNENRLKESKNAVFGYRTFNPQNQDFKYYLLKQNIQVFEQISDNPQKSSGSNFFGFLFIGILLFILYKFVLRKQDSNSYNLDNKVNTNNDESIPIKFCNIAGNEEAKEEMMFLVDFLKNPEKYNKMGAEIPKGVIFYGEPGTGKTLMAKAIAGEANVPFFYASGSDFVEMYVGVGAKRVRELFNKARKSSPCIIFIDEIDAVGGNRGMSNNNEKDQTLNQLLTELDGFNGSDQIVVIAATNRVDMLDSALVRAGRFDKHIAIRLPDVKDRENILKLHSKDKILSLDVDFNELAKLTIGFSGADIKALLNEAAIIATIKDKNSISKADIEESYLKMITKANLVKNKNKSIEDKELVSYHEAGHAILAKLLTKNDVHKVTIIGTTNGAGGLTAITPKKMGLLSKKELYNEVKILYGGRAAEYILFNEDEEKVTTGAINDIEKATTIIDNIICYYGMSDIGPIKFDHNTDKEKLFELRKKIATNLYEDSIKILKENKSILDIIAKALIEKETLSGDEIDDLMGITTLNY